MLILVLLALATASISLTLAKSHLFEGWRQWALRRNRMLGKFAACAYCISHWVAAIFVLWVAPVVDSFMALPLGALLNFIVLTFVIVTLSGVAVGITMRALFIHEREVQDLRDEITDLYEVTFKENRND